MNDRAKRIVDELNATAPGGKVVHGALVAAIYATTNKEESMPTTKTPRFHALLKELRRALAPSYVILVGSAPLAARGWRDVEDLDVLVESTAFDLLRKAFPEDWREEYDHERDIYAATTPAGMIQLSAHAAPFVGKVGLVAWDIVKLATPWEGWLLMDLDQVRAVKRARGQDKDQDDLRLIASRR